MHIRKGICMLLCGILLLTGAVGFAAQKSDNGSAVLTQSFDLRSLPGDGENSGADLIPEGTRVEILLETVFDGQTWVLVRTMDKDVFGYLPKEILTYEIVPAEPTKPPAPTPTPVPAATPEPQGNRWILFEDNPLILYVGNQKRVQPEIRRNSEDAPRKTTLLWESSNENAVKVSQDGLIRAYQEGTYTVTATAKDDSAIQGTLRVQIVPAVSELKLNKKETTLLLGGDEKKATETLKVTIEPADAYDQSVSWKSSNEKIVKVSSQGKLTAISAGRATITASTSDRSLPSQKTATCQVTVKQAVQSIEMEARSIEIATGKSKRMSVTILPKNASDQKVTWSSTNESVATVSSTGNIVGNSAGTCEILCTAADGSGAIGRCKVTVLEPITGVQAKYAQTPPTYRLMLPVDGTAEIKMNITPKNATRKRLKWAMDVGNRDKISQETDDSIQLLGLREGDVTLTGTTQDGTKKTVRINVRVEPSCSGEETNNGDQGTQGGIPWITPYVLNVSEYRTIKSLTLKIHGHNKRDDVMDFVYETTVEIYIEPGQQKKLPRVIVDERLKDAYAICYTVAGATYTDGTSGRRDHEQFTYFGIR